MPPKNVMLTRGARKHQIDHHKAHMNVVQEVIGEFNERRLDTKETARIAAKAALEPDMTAQEVREIKKEQRATRHEQHGDDANYQKVITRVWKREVDTLNALEAKHTN
jgi:hypothetical protein